LTAECGYPQRTEPNNPPPISEQLPNYLRSHFLNLVPMRALRKSKSIIRGIIFYR
jgi:hypothetical protein